MRKSTGLAIFFSLLLCLLVQALYAIVFSLPATMMYETVGWPLPLLMTIVVNGAGAYAALCMTLEYFKKANFQGVFYGFSSIMLAMGLVSVLLQIQQDVIGSAIVRAATILGMIAAAKLAVTVKEEQFASS